MVSSLYCSLWFTLDNDTHSLVQYVLRFIPSEDVSTIDVIHLLALDVPTMLMPAATIGYSQFYNLIYTHLLILINVNLYYFVFVFCADFGARVQIDTLEEQKMIRVEYKRVRSYRDIDHENDRARMKSQRQSDH